MSVTDLKISLRKRGTTNFATDGFRMLPITDKTYVIGLLGSDGKINPDLIPAWLYAGRHQAGIADLVSEAEGGVDIHSIFISITGFNMATPPDASAQGEYVEITQTGELTNESANSALYEIVGAGNAGDKTFPMILQTGDYIVLAKVNASNPKYSFAIVDNTYGDASTTAKGIVQLFDGVTSTSTTLAPTAAAVKTAYDLAATKETAFTKNTAFNKNFTASGGDAGTGITVARGDHKHDGLYSVLAHNHSGVYEPIFTKLSAFNRDYAGTGSANTTARSDHYHSTYDRAASALVGGVVFSDIVVQDGIVTALSTRTLTAASIGTGPLDDGADSTSVVWSGGYLTDLFSSQDGTNSSILALAKKGIEYYTSVTAADAGGHNLGDVVAVLEA